MALDYTTEEHQALLIIWIDGSNDYADWRRNLQFRSRDLGRGRRTNRVDHKEAVKLLRLERDAIRRHQHVLIIAHSRGAAIGQNLARELAVRGFEVDLVAYGYKRTGNGAFVAELEAIATVRAFRHRGDIVPLLPPWRAGLRHELIGAWKPPCTAHMSYGWRSENVDAEQT